MQSYINILMNDKHTNIPTTNSSKPRKKSNRINNIEKTVALYQQPHEDDKMITHYHFVGLSNIFQSIMETYNAIFFKADKRYQFTIQSNQEKMLSVYDVCKVSVSERLNLLV